MTTHNNGGPAFPCEVGPASDGHTIQTGNMQWMQSGMTMRDYFAAKAIAEVDWANNSVQNGTKWAYELADAMLKARETP